MEQKEKFYSHREEYSTIKIKEEVEEMINTRINEDLNVERKIKL